MRPGHAARASSQVQRARREAGWSRKGSLRTIREPPSPTASIDGIRSSVKWSGHSQRRSAAARSAKCAVPKSLPRDSTLWRRILCTHGSGASGGKRCNGGIDRRDPEDRLPLGPTWEIYELWCFVALARKLREWLPDYEWKDERRADCRRFTGRRGDGQRITLHLQRTFRNTRGRQSSESWSVSSRFIPDLVLTSHSADGMTRFVVLDAKYRAAEAGILSGMTESAHPYADALRWGRLRPESTLLLIPNAKEAEWLTRPGLRWETPRRRRRACGRVSKCPTGFGNC